MKLVIVKVHGFLVDVKKKTCFGRILLIIKSGLTRSFLTCRCFSISINHL